MQSTTRKYRIVKKINILWTGGWDSTYRILCLMNKEVSIQPYYLKDNRKSEDYELKAIEKITKEIRNHSLKKCTLLDLITLDVSEIAEDKEITNAYKNILKNDYFGSQYDWLARFANTIKNIELAIHQDDKAFLIIKKYGNTKVIYDEIYGKYEILDKSKSSDDLIKVFGNYCFPVLDSSKMEMKRWAESTQLIDIMNMTWFCYHPKNEKPCGTCNPCIYTIEEGLEYRFSKRAFRKYRIISPVKKSTIYKYIKRIQKRFF